VPYEAPYLALLFKAKNGREKDNADLAGALPLLERGQRAWLAGTIARLHPGHAWLERLWARIARTLGPLGDTLCPGRTIPKLAVTS
jgi:hypothetical protein